MGETMWSMHRGTPQWVALAHTPTPTTLSLTLTHTFYLEAYSFD